MWQENVVAQQTRSEDPGIDCVQHEGPDVNSSGLTSPLAKRIRGLREGAGHIASAPGQACVRVASDGDQLGKGAHVTGRRESETPFRCVWHHVGRAFGRTFRGVSASNRHGDRRTIKVAITLNFLWMLEILVGIVVTSIAHKFLSPDQAYTISDTENIVHWSIMIASIVASWKMQGIKIEHNLESVVDVAAFLEGYEPGRGATTDVRMALATATLDIGDHRAFDLRLCVDLRPSDRFEAGVMRCRAWVRM